MKGRAVAVRPFALALVLLASAPPVAAQAGAASHTSLPHDVAAFLARREQCAHWAGEEPYDAARGRDIDAAISRLHCTRIERDARMLRQRYAGWARILRLLRVE